MNADRNDFLLYAVTDRSWLGSQTLCDQVEQALLGGATCVQLREKQLDETAFLEEARALRRLCRAYRVPLIINDSVDIALAVDADGVHVGQDDLEAGAARQKLGPHKILGVSAHSVEQARRAQAQGADYLGVGAVFPTATKADAGALPPGELGAICRAVPLPVVAIGGVTADNVPSLAGTGIAGVAVVSALFAQADIRQAAARLRQQLAAVVSP